MVKEIWKDVVGYEGIYKISNYGRIKKGNKIFKTEKYKNYFIVKLTKNGVRKRTGVHRLVAQAFIPNPNNLPEINHKDENPSNNCVDNLEWCDRKYNMNYGNVKKKISIATSGKNNPFYGKKHTKQSKEKMKKSREKYIEDHPEYLKRMSEITTKRFEQDNILWINNGIKDTRIKEKELNLYLKNGWKLGRINTINIKKSLKKYYKNNPEKRYWGANISRRKS